MADLTVLEFMTQGDAWVFVSVVVATFAAMHYADKW